jgi:glycosyltransferase involved in cell wall biosynthesis
MSEVRSRDAGAGHLPTVEVIICTHDRPVLLERCLSHLKKIDYTAYSVVVVDSAPSTGQSYEIATKFDVAYVRCDAIGLSRARNLGLEVASADIVVYLDDDMIPRRDWLTGLVNQFADSKVVAVTGPMLPLELLACSDTDLQSPLRLATLGGNVIGVDRKSEHWFERANFGGIGDGNFAARRLELKAIKGFDVRLGRGAIIDSGEEHYAFFKLLDLGHKIIYEPRAVVFHPRFIATNQALQRNFSDYVAYVAFLCAHHPTRSLRLAKYSVEALFGVKRNWRRNEALQVMSLSPQKKLVAFWAGLRSFVRTIIHAAR